MNTYLLELFDKYNISDRDRYEIQQIFMFLPDQKKKNLLDNFAILAGRIMKIDEEMKIEKQVFIGEIVDEIKERMEKDREIHIENVRKELDLLKKGKK